MTDTPEPAGDPNGGNSQPPFFVAWLIFLCYPLLVALVILFGGGWSGFRGFFTRAPNTKGRRLTRKRRVAERRLAKELAEITDGGTFVADLVRDWDSCSKGQNNWKVKQGYVYRCSVGGTHLYAFSAGFRTTLLALDGRLESLGWSAGQGLAHMLTHYGDGFDSPKGAAESIPTSNYERDGSSLSLEFLDSRYVPAWKWEHWPEGRSAIDRIVADGRFVMVVALSRTYFQN